jgi:hypothetical protein
MMRKHFSHGMAHHGKHANASNKLNKQEQTTEHMQAMAFNWTKKKNTTPGCCRDGLLL